MVCFILLLYLWVNRTRIPGVVSALMVLPVIWGNLDAGLRSTDGQLLELPGPTASPRGKPCV